MNIIDIISNGERPKQSIIPKKEQYESVRASIVLSWE